MSKKTENLSVFETLSKINVEAHVEKKSGQRYLSWAWAWAEVKKIYPSATYKIIHDPQTDKPYIHDPVLGFMCMTEVTIEGETLPMWLPVMDGANNAMKEVGYTYKVKEWKNGRATGKMIDKPVVAATMFDVNKTLMRCFTKNLAMFGLGHYLYTGDDLPQEEKEEKAEKAAAKRKTTTTKKKVNKPAAEKAKPEAVETKTPTPPKTGKGLILNVDDENWGNVTKYVEANQKKGHEFIIGKLAARYNITLTVSKAIENMLINLNANSNTESNE